MAINSDKIWKFQNGANLVARYVNDMAMPFYYVYFKGVSHNYRLVSAAEIEDNFRVL